MPDAEPRTRPFRVAVGYDFSDQANLALERAIWLLTGFDHAEIHVVAAIDKARLNPDFPRVEASFEGSEKIRERIKELADSVIAEVKPRSVELLVHTRIGNPADSVLSVADDTRADMILVGTHSKKGLSRLVLGSVSERIVREAHCPVLVVRGTSYGEARPDGAIEPPCPRCVETRRQTEGASWWCDLHDHAPPYPSPLRAHHTHDPESSRRAAWPLI